MSNLVLAALAGLAGMAGWGFADFCAKKTVDTIGGIASLVWAHLYGTGFFAVAVVFQIAALRNSVHFPSAASTWAALAGFGALQMLVYWLAYEGFGRGQVAVLSPVFSSYSGVVALVAIVFLGEHASSVVVVALGILFAGILLLNLDFGGARLDRVTIVPGLKEVGAAAVLAAVWTIYWDRFIGGHDFLAYALLMYIFMTFAAVAVARVKGEKLGGVTANTRAFLLLIGLGEAIAYIGISLGYAKTSYTGVVALISGSFALPTIVLAHLFLKERITSTQIVAILVIFAGLILVLSS